MAGAKIPTNAYAVLRAAAEFYMRGIDLLGDIQSDNLTSGLVFITLWLSPSGARPQSTQPMSIREVARRLSMPYETIRRHTLDLVRTGKCVSTKHGIAIPPAVLRRRRTMTTLRRLYLSTLRLIGDLERADFVQSSRIKHGSPGGALSKDEKIIARAGTTTLLASVKASMEYAGGDLFKGLVLTAIWSANVKHVTNSSKSATTTILPDYQRRPVSVLAISRSLRLPYETTRRYAKILMDEKICVRAGRKGLIMSEAVHRASTDMTLRGYGIITSLISDLRQAGIRIEKS